MHNKTPDTCQGTVEYETREDPGNWMLILETLFNTLELS